jgi:CDP-glucose 4,6-dehydratase|tara:strand:+ start:645 stop:1733 length:1089 start_codon:yes stop_codon:yes gene_type:complete
MEKLGLNKIFWKDKSVFLTGHTGFKGGWMAHWLSELGAQVHGYALLPPKGPNFFTVTNLRDRLLNSSIGDIRDLDTLSEAITKSNPDIVIHMAAQPLVRKSYHDPIETFGVNVMGTVNILEAARRAPNVRSIVNITTDKCYDNKEWLWPYRECDSLGGHDPYSASKACSEIATAAYRNSFFAEENIYLATARAGNVIGGGDWASDRLIPDFLRAIDEGKTLNVRSPNALRPWQHVLEPLLGYLKLAEGLYDQGSIFAESWNFGPNDEDTKSVGWIVEKLCSEIKDAKWKIETIKQPHEAVLLKLDSSKAKVNLGWYPRWDLDTALSKTVEWHQAWKESEDMDRLTSMQITDFLNADKNVRIK